MNTIDRLNNARYTVTLSAHLSSSTPEQNAEATKGLHHDVRALCLKHEHATGVYKGSAEPSIVVYAQTLHDVLGLINLGRKYNQECVLVVADNTATLVYSDSLSIIGHAWAQVALADTYELDAYTYIDGHYFVIA
jgi:hypothetical protein